MSSDCGMIDMHDMNNMSDMIDMNYIDDISVLADMRARTKFG